MKLAPRLVAAALALAAIVSMPFSQPAYAEVNTGKADLAVEPLNWERFGKPWGPNDHDPNMYVRSWYVVRNVSQYNSGKYVVAALCHYPKGNPVAAKPVYTEAALKAGGSKIIFECRPHNGTIPTSSSLQVRGEHEPQSNMDNNTAEQVFVGLYG